jgi:uncharacterized RDD family membrane protein YckC
MDMNETRMLTRAEVLGSRAARREEKVTLRPARASLRLLAYLVDWLVAVILGSVLVSIGGLQLYLASGRGQHDAPDGAIYAFLTISLLFVPLWALITLAAWARGRSVGKLALGLRIVDPRGRRPGLPRALGRLLVFTLENLPLLGGAALVAAWLASDGGAPGWVLPAALLSLLVSLASLLPALRRLGGRPLHDIAAGTLVIEE